jgi:hypothetical protein
MLSIHDYVKRGNIQEVKELFDSGKHTHNSICGVASRYNQLECLIYLHSEKGYPVTYNTMRDAILGNSVECLSYAFGVIGGLVRNTQEEKELLELASCFPACFHYIITQYPEEDRIKLVYKYINNTLFDAIKSDSNHWITSPNDKQYLTTRIQRMKQYVKSHPNLSSKLRENADYSDRCLEQTTKLSECYRRFADVVDIIPAKIEQCSYLVTQL